MMASTVHMPEVLTGVAEASIQTWLVSAGQTVEVGTPLAEIETDKAVVEYASEHAGTVLRILVEEGASVPIGEPIALVGDPGEAVPDDPAADSETNATTDAVAVTDAAADAAAEAPSAPAEALPAAGDAAASRLFASPLVRRLARANGVDLAEVPGTGPNGRVVRRDLEAHLVASPRQAGAAPAQAAAPASPAAPTASAAPAPAAASDDHDEIPLTGMRRAIARRLTESKTTVPHFYVEVDCAVDALLALRAQINESSPTRISVNDLVLKAAAGALRDVPEANRTWGDTVIRQHRSVDIAVAVAVDGGLLTPVLRDVDRLSISQVSDGVADLVERARAGRLKQHELEGGAFSISNLGMYGVKSFSAIINPPHAGILAVGAARRTVIVDGDELRAGMVMTVTLSADHRVIDGAVAAQWLQAFTRRVENPLTILF